MKKAILVGALTLAIWTNLSMHSIAAPDSSTESPLILAFLRACPPYTPEDVRSGDGDEWLEWSADKKVSYVKGFLAGVSVLGYYAIDMAGYWETVYQKTATQHYEESRANPDDMTAFSLYVQADLAAATLRSLADEFERASYFRFRVGAYIVELEYLYYEPLNRSIQLVDAMYIANERLNGRDVDLTVWRNRGKQEGT